MKLKELMDLIINSTFDQWYMIPTCNADSGPSYHDKYFFNEENGVLRHEEHSRIIIYKPDISITISSGLSMNDDFVEPWANKFAVTNASSSFADVFFNNSLVFRTHYVIVDGGRCRLPMPKSANDLSVQRNYVKFVRLVEYTPDMDSQFDKYFKRAGLIEVDEEWPNLS